MSFLGTPGPWMATGPSVYSLNSSGTNSMFIACQPGINEAGKQTAHSEVCANAHLIAAAPELYAALEGLVRACELRALFGCKHVASMRGEQNARVIAHAALTKATEQQP